MGASRGGQGRGCNDFRGLESGVKDLLTNDVWGSGDDGPCRVFSVWVAVLQRGEGRVWLAVLFGNGFLLSVSVGRMLQCGFDELDTRASRSNFSQRGRANSWTRPLCVKNALRVHQVKRALCQSHDPPRPWSEHQSEPCSQHSYDTQTQSCSFQGNSQIYPIILKR